MNFALSSNNNYHLKQLCNNSNKKLIITINTLNNSILEIKLTRLSVLSILFPTEALKSNQDHLQQLGTVSQG